MVQTGIKTQQTIAYYFLKSKDVYIENNEVYITLFARLTREITSIGDGKNRPQVETLWVEIIEMPQEHAPEKVRILPNCMNRYMVSELVFKNLYQLSKVCPRELFYVTPYYQKSSRKNYIS